MYHEKYARLFSLCSQPAGNVGEHVRGARNELAIVPTKPVINGESGYEDASNNDAWRTRMYAWHTAMAGTAGYSYGHGVIWYFGMGWQAALNATGAQHVFGPYAQFMATAHKEGNVPAQNFVLDEGSMFPNGYDFVSALRSVDILMLEVTIQSLHR